jgi:hypothetical protein
MRECGRGGQQELDPVNSLEEEKGSKAEPGESRRLQLNVLVEVRIGG